MIKLCIVDDSQADSLLLKKYIEKYQIYSGVSFHVTTFHSGVEFINNYDSEYDIVFMDIEMPEMDGMETAKKLREMDQHISIVFVTNMAQFAIKGYEVKAIDFMVKPLNYYNFVDKLKRAIDFLEINIQKEIVITNGNKITRIPVTKIYYIEKDKNYIVYHSSLGEFRVRGNMSDAMKQLEKYGFSKCIRGCLVNLKYVKKTNHNSVWAGDAVLPISRAQKEAFINDLMNYLGGNR